MQRSFEGRRWPPLGAVVAALALAGCSGEPITRSLAPTFEELDYGFCQWDITGGDFEQGADGVDGVHRVYEDALEPCSGTGNSLWFQAHDFPRRSVHYRPGDEAVWPQYHFVDVFQAVYGDCMEIPIFDGTQWRWTAACFRTGTVHRFSSAQFKAFKPDSEYRIDFSAQVATHWGASFPALYGELYIIRTQYHQSEAGYDPWWCVTVNRDYVGPSAVGGGGPRCGGQFDWASPVVP
jgi:hypothetical protein